VNEYEAKDNITFGILSVEDDDSGIDSIAQVESDEKPFPCAMVSPYGVSANIPANCSIIVLSSNGDAGNRAGIPFFPENRFRGLKPWEVKIGNYQTKGHVFFANTGDIHISPTSELAEDWAVQFSAMNQAYDDLKADLNALVTKHNDLLIDHNALVAATAAHTHLSGAVPPPDNAGSMIPSTATGTSSSASMTDAKVDKVRLP
jgi:hypothetical protein